MPQSENHSQLPPPSTTAPPPAPPLAEAERRRGRRLAISSHPLGMTFFMVFTQHLPTLALVSLGASETIVGIQSALHATELLQLPTLRAVARVSKRSILVIGQTVALVVAVPLLFFDVLSRLSADGSSAGAWIALLSLALATASINVSNTVWFPMLRSYVEPTRIGRFFGVLRSGWHLALIFYYLAAQYWLARHPGEYGPLFLVAWVCGLVRVFMIWRLPERSERTGERIRIREALALVRTNPLLRRYLVGVTWGAAMRMSVVPFVMVMMRREVGFSSGHVLFTTVASFAGGLASLYLWGRVVDRIGPAPVFRLTALGMGLLTAGLVAVQDAGDGDARRPDRLLLPPHRSRLRLRRGRHPRALRPHPSGGSRADAGDRRGGEAQLLGPGPDPLGNRPGSAARDRRSPAAGLPRLLRDIGGQPGPLLPAVAGIPARHRVACTMGRTR